MKIIKINGRIILLNNTLQYSGLIEPVHFRNTESAEWTDKYYKRNKPDKSRQKKRYHQDNIKLAAWSE